MSNLVYAIHKISIGQEEGEAKITTGRFDADGNPIFKRVSRRVMPGTIFDLPEGKTRTYLMNLGAIRLPTELELVMHERGIVDAPR